MISPDDIPRIDATKMMVRRQQYGWAVEMVKAGLGLFAIVHGEHWVFTVIGVLLIIGAVGTLLLPSMVKVQSDLAKKIDPHYDEQRIFLKLRDDRKLELRFQKGMLKGALEIDPVLALDLADKLRFYAENIQGTQAYAETQKEEPEARAQEPAS